MMCKTIKKGVVGAGVAAVAAGLLFGKSAFYHARTAVHEVREAAQRNVPIEYKIDEARQQVAALEPAIKENIEALVRAQLEAERLQEQVALARANLKGQGEEMAALKDGLEAGRLQLTSGVVYTADEIRCDLERRLDTFRRSKETVQNLEQTLKAKVSHVAAIRKALEEMSTQKKALLVKIEAIESQLAQIRAAQATSEFTYDTTPLSKARQTIDELDRQLEVMSRKAELEARYIERDVTVEVQPDRDIIAEVEAELEGHDEAPAPVETGPST